MERLMTLGLTVLAVDDSLAIRSLLRAILRTAGHQVVTAGDVRSGVRILESLRPDVILTDFNMPDLTGYDFVRRVRADERFTATPIFVVSSEEAVETRALMAAAGANGWIAKPVSPRDLLGVIEAVQWTNAARDDRRRDRPMLSSSYL
jgi:two-component system chemotaxis response regulator CheY